MWLRFDKCVVLKEQHRFNLSDPSGRALYDLVQQLTTGNDLEGRPLTNESVAAIADIINDCALSRKQLPTFLQEKPKALVLRHVDRGPITRTLVSHHAAVDKQRVIVWRAKDNIVSRKKTGKQPSSHILAMLENSTVHPGKMPAVMYFYPGMPYRFTTNDFPLLGWVNNAECVAHSIILNDNEPLDPGTGDFHVLKYQPVAIMVSIQGRDVTGMFGPPVPPNCIPVFSKHSDTFLVDWSKTSINVKLYADRNDLESAHKFTVRRMGFPLEVALAFTDFFAQGQSFKGAPHLLHLNIGKRESYKKANILVPVSRPATLADLKLANPLWTDAVERERVISKFATALKPCPDYLAEMDRLRALHDATMSWMQDNVNTPAPTHNKTLVVPLPQVTPSINNNVTVPVLQTQPPTPICKPRPRRTKPLPTPRRLQFADDAADDVIIDKVVQPTPVLTTRATFLTSLGRHECAYADTEALGDCGPLAILQTMFFFTCDPALLRSAATAMGLAKQWADARCAAFRQSICAAIHRHQDLQDIFEEQYNGRQDWRRMASDLGRCVESDRCARHNQGRPGIWLNELGLRASARHMDLDIVAFSGAPGLPGSITLYPATPGPHVDDLGRSTIQTLATKSIAATSYRRRCSDARTIVIALEDMHFRCTRPSTVASQEIHTALSSARADAIRRGQVIRTFRAISDL